MTISQLRWRKFAPIDRDTPIFELVDGDEIIFDLSRNDRGELEVAFYDAARGRVLELNVLDRLLAEGRTLLSEEDDPSS